jgi:hypothetical protein
VSSLGVILITGAVLGLVFLLWLVLEGEQAEGPFPRHVPQADIESWSTGPGYDPTEGIVQRDVYPDDLRGSH